MAQLIHNCPRCGTKKITLDVHRVSNVSLRNFELKGEAFASCRSCNKTTVFLVSAPTSIVINQELFKRILSDETSGMLADCIEVKGFVSARDLSLGIKVPEHVPGDIAKIFDEGVVCESVNCFNAAGTMFRPCLDKATEKMLPSDGVDGLNAKIRRSLGLRLAWLINTKRIDPALDHLSHCIKEDGNDGAHQGALTKIDVEDLRDFTTVFLERVYSMPERIRLAAVRRGERRAAS